MANEHGQGPKQIHFKIDKDQYVTREDQLTGTQLRAIAQPPIGADRDLFLEVHHGDDPKIEDDKMVDMKPGLHFYTAPRTINPGAGDAAA